MAKQRSRAVNVVSEANGFNFLVTVSPLVISFRASRLLKIKDFQDVQKSRFLTTFH